MGLFGVLVFYLLLNRAIDGCACARRALDRFSTIDSTGNAGSGRSL
jgi:hypothetical protein